jgi:hypothetical protein
MPDGYFNYREFSEPVMLNMAKSGDDTQYVGVLCAVLCDGSNALDSRIAETIMRDIGGHNYPTTFYDMRFSYDLLKSRIYRMADKVSYIYDKVDVQVTWRTQSGIF